MDVATYIREFERMCKSFDSNSKQPVPCKGCPFDGLLNICHISNMADKADECVALAENAALREKQRWIPVTERMPEELILVNVVWVNRAPESYYEKIKDVSFSGTACFYRENWYWDSPVVLDLLAEYGKDDPDLVDDAVEITHWMPLPPVPKGDEK